MMCPYAIFLVKPLQHSQGMNLKAVSFLHHARRTKRWPTSVLHFGTSGQVSSPNMLTVVQVTEYGSGIVGDSTHGRMSSSKIPQHYAQLPHASQEEEGAALFLQTQNLFMRWVIALQKRLSSSTGDGIDQHFKNVIYHDQLRMSSLLKNAFVCFCSLDAAIRFPLLIFIPWYLAIKLVYGAEVLRQLTSLWILGPVIAVIYIKLVQGLCILYVFLFRKTADLARHLQKYCMRLYIYVAKGELKEFLRIRLVNVIQMDYKQVPKKKFLALKEWALEKHHDCIELIWPFYHEIFRFLKRSYLI